MIFFDSFVVGFIGALVYLYFYSAINIFFKILKFLTF
jgi:hypothetical protein